MSGPSILWARVFVALLCCIALRAHAGIVTVTSNADDGPSTLRAAIAAANPGDTIHFSLPVNSVITLESTLTLTKNITIDGSAVRGLTINGNNYFVEAFVVNSVVVATIANLTITQAVHAIHNQGTLTVYGATLANNSSFGGGAIYNQGTLTVTNSTFSENTTPDFGGAIYQPTGSATITNNTFVDNSAVYGGGIYFSSNLPSTVTNNLFLENTADQYGGSLGDAGIVVHADHNLYWNNADADNPQGINCNFCASNTNAVNADPLLGSLANNGGVTATYLLVFGSPAIDAGALAACPATDQRGVVRPQPAGGACDIGAVEYKDPIFHNGFESP